MQKNVVAQSASNTMKSRWLCYLLPLRRVRLIGKSAVLKTAARKGLGVRVSHPPPSLRNHQGYVAGQSCDFGFNIFLIPIDASIAAPAMALTDSSTKESVPTMIRREARV